MSIFISKRAKYAAAEEKYKILITYEDAIGSIIKIASMYKINKSTLRTCIYNFEKHGLDELRELKTWKS